MAKINKFTGIIFVSTGIIFIIFAISYLINYTANKQ